MRAIRVAAWLLIVLVAAPAGAQRSAEPQSLRTTNRLPPRYVTKDQAKARGWRGGGLCALWPGHVIGGDVFHNSGGSLPDMPGRRYREADLDSDCRSRGPRRLVFSSDGRIYVTLDHYNSFVPVP